MWVSLVEGAYYLANHPVIGSLIVQILTSTSWDQGLAPFKLCDHHLWRVALTCISSLTSTCPHSSGKGWGKGSFFLKVGIGGCLCKNTVRSLVLVWKSPSKGGWVPSGKRFYYKVEKLEKSTKMFILKNVMLVLMATVLLIAMPVLNKNLVFIPTMLPFGTSPPGS